MAEHECWACEDSLGYRVRHEVVFHDSRTGRGFCHEHAHELISWELDESPADPDLSGWLAQDAEQENA